MHPHKSGMPPVYHLWHRESRGLVSLDLSKINIMKRALILTFIVSLIALAACKKDDGKKYCYRSYVWVSYYLDSAPTDTLLVLDTTVVTCYNTFKGDTGSRYRNTTYSPNTSNGQASHSRDSVLEVYQH